MSESFVAKVIKNNRITIPKEVADLADISVGDYVQVTIDKKTKKEST